MGFTALTLKKKTLEKQLLNLQRKAYKSKFSVFYFSISVGILINTGSMLCAFSKIICVFMLSGFETGWPPFNVMVLIFNSVFPLIFQRLSEEHKQIKKENSSIQTNVCFEQEGQMTKMHHIVSFLLCSSCG